jgi:hypothetical protein
MSAENATKSSPAEDFAINELDSAVFAFAADDNPDWNHISCPYC